MNILFFLTPKSMIKCVESTYSIRQVLEIFEHYRFSIIPVINKKGKYVKTISEGDLLYYLKNNLKFNITQYEQINIMDVPTYRNYEAISVLEDMDKLVLKALDQNFVPVIDDLGSFVGIITRKSLIKYLVERNDNK